MKRRPARCQDRQGSSDPYRTYGFTILELLVVVAVVMILLAVLVPSLRSARSQAKRSVCSSNLRQLAGAWQMYLDAHNGHFLRGVDANWTYGGKQGIGGPAYGAVPKNPQSSSLCALALAEECTNQIAKPLNRFLALNETTFDGADIFACPADTGGGKAAPRHYDYYGTSYPTNLMLVGQDQLQLRLSDPCRKVIKEVNRRLQSLRLHHVTQPGKLILAGDGGWLNCWDIASFTRIEWHDRRCSHNVAFLDSHVEFQRIHKGLHVTQEYTVLPWGDLFDEMQACQRENQCH